MSDEYGSNFVSLTDEDGNEIELEHLDTIEYNGAVYMAFFPVDEADEEGQPPEDDDDEAGLIILKVVEIDGRSSSPPWRTKRSWRLSISSSWRPFSRKKRNKASPARFVMVSF